MWTLSGPARTPMAEQMRRQYGYTAERAKKAPGRLCDIVTALADQLKIQQVRGSPYLIGDQASACDFYWASFSIMFDVPEDLKDRIPEYQRAMYETKEQCVMEALDPLLLIHRDMMFEKHIGLPIKF